MRKDSRLSTLDSRLINVLSASVVVAAIAAAPGNARADDELWNSINYPASFCTGATDGERSIVHYDGVGLGDAEYMWVSSSLLHTEATVVCPILRDMSVNGTGMFAPIFDNLYVDYYDNDTPDLGCTFRASDTSQTDFWIESESSSGTPGIATLTFNNVGVTTGGTPVFDGDWYAALDCDIPDDNDGVRLYGYRVDYPGANAGTGEQLDDAISYPSSMCNGIDEDNRARLTYQFDYLRNTSGASEAKVVCPLLRDRSDPAGTGTGFLSSLKVYLTDNSGGDYTCELYMGNQDRTELWSQVEQKVGWNSTAVTTLDFGAIDVTDDTIGADDDIDAFWYSELRCTIPSGGSSYLFSYTANFDPNATLGDAVTYPYTLCQAGDGDRNGNKLVWEAKDGAGDVTGWVKNTSAAATATIYCPLLRDSHAGSAWTDEVLDDLVVYYRDQGAVGVNNRITCRAVFQDPGGTELWNADRTSVAGTGSLSWGVFDGTYDPNPFPSADVLDADWYGQLICTLPTTNGGLASGIYSYQTVYDG